MKIAFTNVENHDFYNLYKVAAHTPEPKCGSYMIISLIIQELKINGIVEAFIDNNLISLTINGKKIPYELHIGNKSLNQLKLWQFGCYTPDTIVLDFSFFNAFKNNGQIDLKTIYHQQIAKFLGPSLAIRCSSNLEDGERQSFAGVFDTYLNVPNEFGTFEEKILRSFQKFSSMENSSQYFSRYELKLGIMVQSMVKPSFSGFLFTTDPMNPPNQWLRIEYWQGEREKSEGSTITLNRNNGKRIRSDRDMSTTPMPLNIQNDLYLVAKKLHKHFGSPQDAEFLISSENEKLYLVQSRPITAFSFSPDKVRVNEQEKLSAILTENLKLYQKKPILSSTNISELFNRAIPLGYSIFKYGFAGTLELEGGISLGRSRLGYAKLDLEDQTRFFYTVADQARTNLIVDALTFRLPGIDKNEYLERFISYYLGKMEQDQSVALYPEYGLYLQNDQLEQWEEIAGERGEMFRKEYIQFLNQLIGYHAPKEYQNAGDFLKKNDEFYRSYLSYNIHSACETKLKLEIEEILKYLRTSFCPHYVVLARLAFLCTYMAKQKLRNLVISEKPIPADHILNKLLRSVDIEAELNEPAYPYFERLLKAGKITLWEFLDRFQHLGSLDIQQPRLGEYSIEELQSIFGPSKQDEFGDGRTPSNDNVMSFESEIKALGVRIKSDFRKWCTYAGRFMRLREMAKFELMKVLYISKRIIKEIAKLHRFGDLIYYLEYNEVLELDEKNREHFRLVALQRKAYFEACGQHQVKKVVINFQMTPFEKKQSESDQDGGKRYKFAVGKSIFYGQAEGICLTAQNNEEYLKKLAAYRDKGIKLIIGIFKGVELSYFNLSALVGFTTENGGFLSHAATIAREFKIPYITGIKIDQFQDGDYIILDTENEQVIYRR